MKFVPPYYVGTVPSSFKSKYYQNSLLTAVTMLANGRESFA